ncbi:hypothetical protein BJY00DRAFT_187071 [Aspergillus carlsbadensis]|nr:hypothetical protein BJY00DRAFT_187071 [Aspergillus carlsbadensis]
MRSVIARHLQTEYLPHCTQARRSWIAPSYLGIHSIVRIRKLRLSPGQLQGRSFPFEHGWPAEKEEGAIKAPLVVPAPFYSTPDAWRCLQLSDLRRLYSERRLKTCIPQRQTAEAEMECIQARYISLMFLVTRPYNNQSIQVGPEDYPNEQPVIFAFVPHLKLASIAR